MRVAVEVRVRVRVRRRGRRGPRVVQRRDAARVERAEHRVSAEESGHEVEALARAKHDAPDAESSAKSRSE